MSVCFDSFGLVSGASVTGKNGEIMKSNFHLCFLCTPRTSSTSEDGGVGLEPLNISLTLAKLESFHGLATKNVDQNDTELTVYAKNGMDKHRVKQAVRHPTCSCRCSAPLALMMKICAAFWCLSKSAQDSILWSLQVSDGDRRKRYYDIEGWAPWA